MALAVDIGGTKLSACLVSADGVLSARSTVPTPAGAAETVWAALASVATTVLTAAGNRPIEGIGIGSAGPVDLVAGTISPVNIPGWRGFPVVRRLASLLPGAPVHLAGDGICAAAGEHWLGAGRGVDDLLVLVVSTGVGGGLVQGGRLVHGPSGNAGHLGHVVVDVDGDDCPCGGIGCVESIASGPSMVAWAGRQGWLGTDRTAIALASSARLGDPIAGAAFERAGRAVGAGIVTTAALCDVSLAIIGGGVAQAADLLMPQVQRHVRRYAKLGFMKDLAVAPAALGAAAGLAGAAALVFDPDRYGFGRS